jgi:hypothetical protein
MSSSAAFERAVIETLKGFGKLHMVSIGLIVFWGPYLTACVWPATSGSMIAPEASLAFAIFKVASVTAIVKNMWACAMRMPGQTL